MNTEKALQTAEILLTAWTKGKETPHPTRLDVMIDAADLPAAVSALQEAGWGYLSALTGLDLGVAIGQFEALYHFCRGAAVVTIRVRIPHENAVVPSVCSVIPSAGFYERELSEMLGITVTGTPDPSRLFLPDEWPAGVYPLRKDFQVEKSEGQVVSGE